MLRRLPVVVLLGVLAFSVACTNKKVNNPLANVGSKQPDKVLFDRSMDAMKHNRFDVARLTLQTLINTYPDSEYIARAKLAVADSWYAEGGTASLQQAEIEYKDFITFFPNMPEAAEAQLKIANIHYAQMEKPDRDYTHALRAQDEYRNLILQFPDSKLVPQAKKKLLEVQEVLAEREFRVGRFYYLREAYPAAIARLKSVVDQYPLYSQADEALYLLGQSYESEIARIRLGKLPEARKAAYLQELTKNASDAYSKILTRYPVMNRAEDAQARLVALHQPVPRPTKEMLAQNKAEEASRRDSGMVGKLMDNFNRHPDVAQATRVGDPTLVDPPMTSATEVTARATRALTGAADDGSKKVTVETVGTDQPAPNQPTPRSDAQPDTTEANTGAASATTSGAASGSSAAQPDAATSPNSSGTGSGELKPNVSPDPNELKPNVDNSGAQPLPPPQQVNEIQNGGANAQAAGQNGTTNSASSDEQAPADDKDIASSRKKKKKGLKKVVPF